MSIRIQKERCVGCRRCVDICPGNLIRSDENGRAYIARPADCWGCTSCIKECRFEAIDFFLGPDIGGRGTVMHVRESKVGFDWTFTLPDGTKKEISVNAKDSNRY